MHGGGLWGGVASGTVVNIGAARVEVSLEQGMVSRVVSEAFNYLDTCHSLMWVKF